MASQQALQSGVINVDAEIRLLLCNLNEDDLRSYIELQEDPLNHNPVAQRIYINCLAFDKFRAVAYLEDAILLAEGWVAETPDDHPDHTQRMNLFNTLSAHKLQSASTSIFSGPVNWHIRVTSASIQPHINRLYPRALLLFNKFESTGYLEDLNNLIVVLEEAYSIAPVHICGTLALHLGKRFEKTRSLDDLELGLLRATEALDTTPHGNPWLLNRHRSILADLHGQKYVATGETDALNFAIKLLSESVDVEPDNELRKFGMLINLGKWHFERFEHFGSMDDLDHAISFTKQAKGISRGDATLLLESASNLAGLLHTRGLRKVEMEDVDAAMKHIKSVLPPLSEADVVEESTFALRNTLACCLVSRFLGEASDSGGDLDEAISILRNVAKNIPQPHPHYAPYLMNLGTFLLRRFEITHSTEDQNDAIKFALCAVNDVPEGDPTLAQHFLYLGNVYYSRFKAPDYPDSPGDLDQAMSRYQQGWQCVSSTPSIRILLGLRLAETLAIKNNWTEANKVLQEAIGLLPGVSSRSLKNTDKQANLATFRGLGSIAASIALNTGEKPFRALQLLELGRGVISSLLLDMRTDIDISDLPEERSDLAHKFKTLRDELDSSTGPMSVFIPHNALRLEMKATRQREAVKDFNAVLKELRNTPEFRTLFNPPTETELMVAAKPGPIVVVNISEYRCDAFPVQHGQISVVELPDLKMKEVEKHVKTLGSDLSTTLAWLWRVAVRPCLDQLGFNQPHSHSSGRWPRVWWIPTGALSHFPLHAAGRHCEASGETAIDRVMSSYSSSIKTLMFAQRQQNLKSVDSAPGNALLIGMPQTPGLSTLPSAADEVAIVEKLCPSLQLKAVKPSSNCRDEVLEKLHSCKSFHFAGHGESNASDPSKSRLFLTDWETTSLTVEDLFQHWLREHYPFLAYLSACSTGAMKYVYLADEAIHLISACQLAGFRHVVGTLWEVEDKYSVDAAKTFYGVLEEEWNDEAVALGAHNAARLLRRETNGWNLGAQYAVRAGGDPLVWAAYVHFGP